MSKKKKQSLPDLVICLDPGTYQCGYIEYYPEDQSIGISGHMGWQEVRTSIQLRGYEYDNVVVCSEEIIIYSHVPGSATILPDTLKHVGRCIQICDDKGAEFKEMIRKDIIEKLTGNKVTRKNKVSKKEMQDTVQKLLDLERPVRPQHVNDALCVGLAFYPPTKAKNATRKHKEAKATGS